MCNTPNKNKFISIITIGIITIFVLLGCIHYSDYLTVQYNYISSKESAEEQLNVYLTSAIYENQSKARSIIEEKKYKVQESISNAYKDNEEQLKKDIENPSENSKLTEIFDEELSGVYINNNSSDNTPFVASLKCVIWDRADDPHNYLNKDILEWSDMINSHYNNSTVSKEAIDTILQNNTQKHDYIIWQNRNSSISLRNMDINELLIAIEDRNYDIEELKSFELLIPLYITDDGDILGNKDVSSLGLRNNDNNFKIIIVQRLNLYDIISVHQNNISLFIQNIDNIETNIMINKRDKLFMIIYILVFISSTIIISGVLQNKK